MADPSPRGTLSGDGAEVAVTSVAADLCSVMGQDPRLLGDVEAPRLGRGRATHTHVWSARGTDRPVGLGGAQGVRYGCAIGGTGEKGRHRAGHSGSCL